MKSERFIVTYRIAANSYDDAKAIAGGRASGANDRVSLRICNG